MELSSVIYASLDGMGVWGRMDTCICMAKSLHCSPETPTTLLIGLSQSKIKYLKLKKIYVLHSEWYIAAAAKSLQSCPTLCHLIDGSPPGSPVPGILQARTLEWVAISFSHAWKWKGKVKSLSCQLLVTPRTAAHPAPPSTGFSRQEYWSRLPFPPLSGMLLMVKSDGIKVSMAQNSVSSLPFTSGWPWTSYFSEPLVLLQGRYGKIIYPTGLLRVNR